MELTANDEEVAGSVPELLEVKERLDKLEETVKEIVVESKKQSGSRPVKDQEGGNEKKHVATAEASSKSGSSESSKSVEKDPPPGNQNSSKPTPG